MKDGGIDIRLLGRLEVTLDGRRVEDRAARQPGEALLRLPGAEPRPRGAPRGARGRDLAGRAAERSGRGALDASLAPAQGPRRRGHRGTRRAALRAARRMQRSTTRRPESALADAERDLERDPDGVRSGLDRAAQALAQELLAGYEAPWLDEARRDQDELRLTALELSTRVARELGDFGGTERSARELIRSFPYRESAHRHLMEALSRQGNTAEALRAYDDLRLMLRDELGTAPSRADHRSARPPAQRAMRSASPRRPGRRPEQRRTRSRRPCGRASTRTTPSSGAEHELAALKELFEARGSRHRSAWRWSTETRGSARRASVRSSRPSWRRTERGSSTDAPRRSRWLSSSRSCRRSGPGPSMLPAASSNRRPRGCPRRRRLVPQLRRRLPELPEPDGEVDRLIVFEDVAEMLARASRSRPMLLVLDDLHWADQPTLLLLTHLIRSPQPIDCLIVGTYRITEFDSPLTDVVADLGRDGPVSEIALDGLTDSDVAELVEAGTGIDADRRRSRPRSPAGPRGTRSSSRSSSGSSPPPRHPAMNGDGLGLPSGASSMVERRLRGVDPHRARRAHPRGDHRARLHLRRCSSWRAARSRGPGRAARARRPSPSVARRGARARRALQLRPRPDPGLPLRSGPSEPRRAQLHLRVAEGARRDLAADNPRALHRAAGSSLRGGRPCRRDERAIEWTTLAGDQAQRLYAHERAADHYREAHSTCSATAAPIGAAHRPAVCCEGSR